MIWQEEKNFATKSAFNSLKTFTQNQNSNES